MEVAEKKSPQLIERASLLTQGCSMSRCICGYSRSCKSYARLSSRILDTEQEYISKAMSDRDVGN